MKYTITIDIDDEANDALTSEVKEINAAALEQDPESDTVTNEEWLAARMEAALGSLVRRRYENASNRLSEGFKTLPYAARLATIANLESQLALAAEK